MTHTYKRREACHQCGAIYVIYELVEVVVCTAKQTHSSPAEYEDVLLCPSCADCLGDERDPDYERANLRWRSDHGGEL